MGELVPFPTGGASPEPKHSLYPTTFCGGCGADRTVPPSAADPGPCPTCGSTIRTSCRPAENGLDYRLTGVRGFVGPIELVSGAGRVSYYFPPTGGAA